MAEIAFLIIAIALAAFLIALIPTLLRTRHVVKEVEETVAVLRTDINVTLHQTNEILAKANVLVEDVNEKVQTIDLELQQLTSLQLKKVKLLKHVLMKKSLHSKKILKLIKIKWWKKLATTKIWQSILSKTIKQNLKMATSLRMI